MVPIISNDELQRTQKPLRVFVLKKEGKKNFIYQRIQDAFGEPYKELFFMN